MFQAPLGKNKNPTATLVKGAQFPFMSFMREVPRKLARYFAIASQGTYTLSIQPTNGQTITIGSKTYTWQTSVTNVDGNILIGATLAQSQQNLIDAINLTGIPGTQYATAMTEHTQVSAATTWNTNTLVITAKTAGVAGNSIATTATAGSFDAATLGTTRAGVDESDADSFLYSAQMTNSNSNYADSFDTYFKNLNDLDQRWGAGWINSEFKFTPELIVASASRKISLPDHFGRRYKSIRSINPVLWTQKDARASIASPFTAHGSNNVYKSIAVDTSRVAYLYGQAGGTTGTYLVIATVNADGSQTFGTPVIMDTNQNIEYVDMVLVNTDKLLVCFANAAATNFIATRTVSLSGTTITSNSLVQVAATAGTTQNTLVKIGTDKAILAWANGTQVSYQVVTVTGTVPSYGTAANITGTPTFTIMVQNGTDKAQAFYYKSSKPTTVTIIASGTSLTIGVELVMMSGDLFGNRRNHDAVQVATDKFVWLGSSYDEANNGDRRNAAFITVSSTTSTLASVAKSGCSGNDTMRIMPITVGSDYYFLYKNGTGLRGKNFTVDTTANTITFPYGNPERDFTEADYADVGFLQSIFKDSITNFGNVGGNCIVVQCGTKTVMMYLGLGSFFHYFSTDRITLEIYVNETSVASPQFNYGFLCEPKYLNTSILDVSANLRIKNTFAQSIYMRVHHTWVEIE